MQQPGGGPDLGRARKLGHLVLVAGHDDDQVGVDPVYQPDPFGDQLTAVVAEDPQLLSRVVGAPRRHQVLLAGGDPGDRQGVDRVRLAGGGAVSPFPHGEPARHLPDIEPDLDQARRLGPAQMPGAFVADPG